MGVYIYRFTSVFGLKLIKTLFFLFFFCQDNFETFTDLRNLCSVAITFMFEDITTICWWLFDFFFKI